MMRAASGLVLVVLAGCTQSGLPPRCDAERYQDLVGQPLSALEAALPQGGYKVDYPLPDGTVTLEEIWDRLRVAVDEDDIIRTVGCG